MKAIFEQSTPSATWTITHNLGKFVVHDVQIYDGPDLHKILPLNATQTINELVLTFSSAQTGQVVYAAAP